MDLNFLTLKDISKALGYSISTVSKALRDSYEISPQTKAIILAYAEKHNYKPNITARSLKQGKSKSIGIIISTIDNHFFAQLVSGVESVAYDKGYNIIITQTHESYEREVLNLNHLSLRSIDGLLISLSSETTDVNHLKKLFSVGLPIVFFDRVSNEVNTHKVISNNYQGAYDGVVHLIENGYKKIAHIGSSPNISITNERLAGYKKALENHNLTIDESYIKFCKQGGKDVGEIEQSIQDLLKLKNPPDAIFTASDRITTSTLIYLKRMNIRIPDSIALIGFTNISLAEVLNPALSSIHQPAFEMGQTAMEMLVNIIESKIPITQFETKVFDTELQIRESCRRKL